VGFEYRVRFSYNQTIVDRLALQFAELSGEVLGVFTKRDNTKQANGIVDFLILEAMKTSERKVKMLLRKGCRVGYPQQLG
jgi:hypothetical protein